MTLQRITPAAAAPLDLDTAKVHARIDGTDRDAVLNGLLAAAVDAVEHGTGRALLAQTWRQIEQAPCGALALGRLPVLELLVVADDRGELVAGTDYTVTDHGPDAVSVAPVGDWQGVVIIEYRAGYGDAPAAVPAGLVSAVALRFMALCDLDQAAACERAAAALEWPFWVARA